MQGVTLKITVPVATRAGNRLLLPTGFRTDQVGLGRDWGLGGDSSPVQDGTLSQCRMGFGFRSGIGFRMGFRVRRGFRFRRGFGFRRGFQPSLGWDPVPVQDGILSQFRMGF